MKPKYYVAGKVTGLELSVAKKMFEDAEKYLIDMGCDVENPMSKICKGTKSWDYYMRRSLKMLLKCDCIYMLKGWRRSKGAKIERSLAKKLGYEISYQSKIDMVLQEVFCMLLSIVKFIWELIKAIKKIMLSIWKGMGWRGIK